MGAKLDDYRAVAPRGSVDFMLRIADRLRGRRIAQVSVSRYGAAAEIGRASCRERVSTIV